MAASLSDSRAQDAETEAIGLYFHPLRYAGAGDLTRPRSLAPECTAERFDSR